MDLPRRVSGPRRVKVDNQQVGALPRSVQEVPVQPEAQGQIFYPTTVERRRKPEQCSDFVTSTYGYMAK